MAQLPDFSAMKKELEEYEHKREELITISRDILRLSKQAIYATHRDDFLYAKSKVAEMNKKIALMKKISACVHGLDEEGSYRIACQEYVEAMIYYHYCVDGTIPNHTKLGIAADLYLLGSFDVFGEFIRRAIHLATAGKYKDVFTLRDMLSDIYGVLLEFEFRNGELRKKFDGLKYDVKKIEELCLQLKLKE